MEPYGEIPNALLNIREAAAHAWMGLTGLLNGRPYLVIGKEGNNFILEGEDGDIHKLLQFEWKDATEDSRLIAASRQEGSALTKGSVLGGYTIGGIRYHEGEWYVMRDDGENVLPFHSIVAKLDALRYDPQALAWDIKKSIRYDSDYKCPECGAREARFNDEGAEAYCDKCGTSGPVEDFLDEPSDYDGDTESLDWYPDWQPETIAHVSRQAGNVESVIASTMEGGGGTFDPLSLDPFEPSSGYFASKNGIQIPEDNFGPEVLSRALETLELTPGEYLGTWVSNGQVSIDPARWFEDLDTALAFGKQNGQQAIWDVANQRDIPVEEPVTSKVASTFEMNLPPHGIHFRTHAAMGQAGLTCTVHYPPIPAYPDGLQSTVPGPSAIEEMDYADEVEQAGGNLTDVRVQVDAPDGTENQVREIINRLGGAAPETM